MNLQIEWASTSFLAHNVEVPTTSKKPDSARRLFVTVIAIAGVAVTASCGGAAAENPAASSSREVPSTPAVPVPQEIVLTFVGDNILGTDANFGAATSLPTLWAESGNDPAYFFQNTKSLFASDDLTVANLEVAFTTSSDKIDKGPGEVYHFKGDPALVGTLTAGDIEAVTVSNNHTGDFGQQGFDDTIATLEGADIDYFGEGFTYLTTLKGLTIGFVGYQAWTDSDELRAEIAQDFADLRAQGADAIVPYFHWGIESTPEPYDVQTALAHFAIDSGAAMVIGSHPHVIQSMEVYNGKLIAYSLANFAFGGNSNPTDKRTFILQTRLHTLGNQVNSVDFRAIPTRISRAESFNDYVPTPYLSPEKEEVLGYLNSLSPTFGGRIATEFGPVAGG
ncbi:capsular biosynthesis protein [Williamsia sp. 1138]|nr:capsular biosynthesis protein [Williamsia sp. 1138]